MIATSALLMGRMALRTARDSIELLSKLEIKLQCTQSAILDIEDIRRMLRTQGSNYNQRDKVAAVAQPRMMGLPTVARAMSTNSGNKLSSFIQLEITEEEEMQREKAPIEETLGNSPFKVDAKGTTESYCVLKNGNATVEFQVSDLEHSEDDEVAIPFEVIIENATLKKEMIFDCIAKRTDDDSEGELLLENVVVKATGSEDGAYSPSFVELNEDVQESFFDYLQDHGVNTEFAEIVLQIAEDREQDLYIKWLREVRAFAKN